MAGGTVTASLADKLSADPLLETEAAAAPEKGSLMADPVAGQGLGAPLPDSQPDTKPTDLSAAPLGPPSGPLPGPGETLVGVLDSQWPLSNPRGLLPGDIILRIGRRGQPGTLRAPFPDGLATVRQSISRRAASEEAVLLQVLRGSSKLELLVSLRRSAHRPLVPLSTAPAPSTAPLAASAPPAAPASGAASELGSLEDAGKAILWGVVLAEGRHSKFSPLAARTEHSILRLERLKAYGFPLDLPLPSPRAQEQDCSSCGVPHEHRPSPNGAGTWGDEASSHGEGPGFRREPGQGTEGVEHSKGEDSQRGMKQRGGGEEAEAPCLHSPPLFSVAATVLPSDPLLEADEGCGAGPDGFAHSNSGFPCLYLDALPLGLGNMSLGLDDTACSEESGDTSHPQELASLGPGTQSAPHSSMGPLWGVGSQYLSPRDGLKGGSLFRMYNRPHSPLNRLTRHASQPDLPEQDGPGGGGAQPAQGNAGGAPVAGHSYNPLGAAGQGGPAFQMRRRTIPETPSTLSAKAGNGGQPASLFTILVLPSESSTGRGRHTAATGNKAGAGLHRRFSDVNHTVERATKWMAGVKSSGAAVVFSSAQTEVLPLRLGGMDAEKLAKVAQYGKWIVKTGDSVKGDHVSVLRAVRLWLVPASEVELVLSMSPSDGSCPDWGLQLSQTQQGIVYISSVAVGSAAEMAGVHVLLQMAEAKQGLLTVTKIQSHVVVPSMISDDGIDCVDVEAIHEQLILHAHLQTPLQITLAL